MPCLFIFEYAESICILVKHAHKLRKVSKKTVKVVLNNRLYRRDYQARNFCYRFPMGTCQLIAEWHMYIVVFTLLHNSRDIKTYLHKPYVDFSHLKHWQCSIPQFLRQNTRGFSTPKTTWSSRSASCLERNVKRLRIMCVWCGVVWWVSDGFVVQLYTWNRTSDILTGPR